MDQEVLEEALDEIWEVLKLISSGKLWQLVLDFGNVSDFWALFLNELKKGELERGSEVERGGREKTGEKKLAFYVIFNNIFLKHIHQR